MAANGEIFNEVAYAYHDVRPSYPKGIIDALVTCGDIPAGGRVLELGSGTGIATRLLAQRKLEVTAVEPGAALIGVARTELGHLPNVRFVAGRFLEAKVEGPFDAVVAATSWKWLGNRREVEERTHSLLGQGGCLGILQNTTAISDGQGDTFYRASRSVYAQYMDGEVTSDVGLPDPGQLRPDPLSRDLFRLAFFGYDIRYDRFSAQEYTDLISTYGPIIRLPAETRRALQADLRGLITNEFDGIASMAHATTLTLAQKVE